MTRPERQNNDTEEQGMPSRETLEATYGPIVGGPELSRLLGYRSGDAFRKATQRGVLPVHTFTLPNRRGQFARTLRVCRDTGQNPT